MPQQVSGLEVYQGDDTLLTFTFVDGYTLTVTATAGTYTLTVGKITTAPVAFGASAATIETALAGTGATVTGTGPYVIVLPDPSLKVSVDVADLTGTATLAAHHPDLSGSTFTPSIATDVTNPVNPVTLTLTQDASTDLAAGSLVYSLSGSDTTNVPMTGGATYAYLVFDVEESGRWDGAILTGRIKLGAKRRSGDVAQTATTVYAGTLGSEVTAHVTSYVDGADLLDSANAYAAGLVDQETTAREGAVAAETTAREAAINAETTARETAITAEATARADGDNAEASARAAAVATESEARQAGDADTLTAAQAYADSRLQDITASTLLPVRAAATADYTAFPFTGLPSSADSDGVTLAEGDRFLLPVQSAASRGGVWIVSAGAWSRPTDFASGATIPSGATVQVLSGDTQALTGWEVTGSGSIDTNVQTWTRLHDTLATAAGVDAGYIPRELQALGSFFGPDPAVHYDDFHRSDRALNGDAAPDGTVYRTVGAASQSIVDHVYAPQAVPADAAILFADLAYQPRVIAGVVRHISDGTTSGENAVIGCGGGPSFGGSVQLFVSVSGWELFYVPQPVVDPYPSLASGSWAVPLVDGRDYPFAMRYDDVTSAVTIKLHDGTVLTVADPAIGTWWGASFGTQLRRPNDTDGHFVFAARAAAGQIGAPGDGASPLPGAVLRVPGDGESFTSAVKPSAPDDLDVRVLVNLDDPASGSDQTILQNWSPTGNQRGFQVRVDATGHLRLFYSLDGTTSTQATKTSTDVIPATAGDPVWLRWTRVASTGDLTFYTSTDPVDSTDVTWTQLGDVVTSTAGTIFDSTAALQLGVGMAGTILVAQLLDGIDGTQIAGVDYRGTWTGVDPQGNTWALLGGGTSWVVAESTVDGLAADLTAIDGRLDTLDGEVLALGGRTQTELTATVTVANTTAQSTLFTADPIPAADLTAGVTLLDLTLDGDIDGIAASGVFTGDVRVNGTVVAQFNLAGPQTNAAAHLPWGFAVKLYVDAVGSGGAVSCLGSYDYVSASGGLTHGRIPGATYTGKPVDLSTGLTVTVTVTMSTADPGNITRAYRGRLRQEA